MLFYISGLAATATALLIWFYGPLKTTIGQIIFSKNIYSNDQFETALLLKSSFLGKLLGCYICCSFWLSLIVGSLLYYVFDLEWYFPLLTWFTYPSILYLYKLALDKLH
jgi:hypothetical protein